MTRGAQHVLEEISRRGISQNSAAELVGADSGNFSKLLRDPKRGPGRELAIRIKTEFGTEIEWWDEPALAADPPAKASNE